MYNISLKEIKAKVEKKKKNSKLLTFLDTEIQNVKTISNEFGETLTRVDGEIPVDLEIENGKRFLFISYDQSRYSHNLHKYPAKFFPELPRWLIKKYSNENDLVLDPFSGSATTNIEALLNKRNSVGIDVDVFAKFLAKVKTTPINKDTLKQTNEILLNEIIKFNPELINEKDIPNFPYRENWFNKEIIYELAHIKKSIENIETKQEIKNFYLVCMSSIIRSVSNADDNCTRTVVRKKLNKQILPSQALTSFIETVFTNTLRINEFSQLVPDSINVSFPDNNDARFIDYPENHFDLALTSPPYVNAVDYPRTHQLELYWLGFASGSLTPMKEKHVGTETVKAIDYKKLHLIGEDLADEKIKKIFEKDPRRAFICYKYLNDMKTNMIEVHRTLKKGGRYIIVVGNNTIRGEIFESWRYLMNISEQIGYKIENYFGSEIIKHFIKVPREERINTDWIIVLQK
jgi:hypothetical protein